jgi:hypothetical protein
MALWREEYLAALAVRDSREKANSALYDACAFLSPTFYPVYMYLTAS